MKPELFFDGKCGVCASAMRWVSKNAPYITVTPDTKLNVSLDAVYFLHDGELKRGHKAVAEVLKNADSKLMRGTGYMLTIYPLNSVAALSYYIISKNRHVVSRFAKLEACAI